jgi:hypothetical protein
MEVCAAYLSIEVIGFIFSVGVVVGFFARPRFERWWR